MRPLFYAKGGFTGYLCDWTTYIAQPHERSCEAPPSAVCIVASILERCVERRVHLYLGMVKIGRPGRARLGRLVGSRRFEPPGSPGWSCN